MIIRESGSKVVFPRDLGFVFIDESVVVFQESLSQLSLGDPELDAVEDWFWEVERVLEVEEVLWQRAGEGVLPETELLDHLIIDDQGVGGVVLF